MANVQYSHHLGHSGYAATPDANDDDPRKALAKMTNLAGGLISLALIAGVAFWSYQLVMRDVSGLPVVRAAEGEMRVKPDEPGGQLAQHQGLAVNEIAANGSAAGPVDQIALAPGPTALADEDMPQPVLMAAAAAPVTLPEPLDVAASLPNPAETLAISGGTEIDALIRELTENDPTIEASPVAENDTVLPPPAKVVQAKFDGVGMRVSLRPQLRPSIRGTVDQGSATQSATIQPAAVVSTRPVVTEVDPASLPVGTRLVQLGAYDSRDIARDQWDRLNTRFGDYLNGKDRVIQQAQSGGRTFFRLRAMGFADLSDARRFCSALVAEGADCIPVVSR